MQAYRLRHRVVIEEPIYTQNKQSGAMDSVWQPLVVDGVQMIDVPAEVFTGPGREAKSAGVIQSSQQLRINLRWFPGLNEHMRVLWDGRIANITGIETDVTGRREWRITAEYGVNNG